MNGRDDAKRRVADITAKLDTGVDLDADDVKFLLAYVPYLTDYGELEAYREEIDESIPGKLGHSVYSSILHEFESAGVIEELRHDLIDPSLDPDGFERVEVDDRIWYPPVGIGKEASKDVGVLHAPEKQPTSLWRIGEAIRDYLFCTGRGFHFDAEMIYDYETDYRNFLQAVIACTDGLDEYELDVKCDERERTTIHVSLCSNDRSYHQEFEHVSDWLRFDALDPLQKALDREASQTIHYDGGNQGWILVLEKEHSDLVMKYI